MPVSFARLRTHLAALVALVTVIGGLVTFGPTTVPASANTPQVTGWDLYQPTAMSVTTSTGKHLEVDVEVFADQGYGTCGTCTAADEVEIEVATPDGLESHQWSFSLSGDADFAPPDTGNPGTFTTQHQLGAFGAVRLTFTPTGSPRTTSCGGRIATKNQKAALSGTIYFATKSSGKNAWGSVGTAAHPVVVSGTGRVTTDYQNLSCDNALPDGCGFGTTWAIAHGQQSVDAKTSTSKRRFSYENVVVLPSPNQQDRVRFDFMKGRVAAARLSRSGKHVTVVIEGDGVTSTGSGEIHAKAKRSEKYKCGSKHTKVRWTLDTGTYTKGPKPLTFHPQVFGPWTPKSGTSALVDTVAKR